MASRLWSRASRFNTKCFAIPFVVGASCSSVALCMDTHPIISKYFDDPEIPRVIFSHISEEYNDLGQVSVDEVDATVAEHVFSQIGVIDVEGVRRLCELISDKAEPFVFCDIGSGVGNVLLQVLAEAHGCRKVVGVEVLPSRHKAAVKAYENAKSYYPEIFVSNARRDSSDTTNASFYMLNLVEAAPALKKEGVNVIFSHSWMFDDSLMVKFAELVASSGPQLRMVVTSRPFEDTNGQSTLPKDWECSAQTTLSADWNSKSPFFIYTRRT